jgi:hypothetical protein
VFKIRGFLLNLKLVIIMCSTPPAFSDINHALGARKWIGAIKSDYGIPDGSITQDMFITQMNEEQTAFSTEVEMPSIR